jgi:hypothetical protein
MNQPFVYGKMAENEFFIDRENETKHLVENFKSLVNTSLISPRRWGKTSLVNKALSVLEKEKGYFIAQVDIFNCRTEEQFYKAYVNAVLQASASKLEEWVALMKRHIGSVGPKITLGDGSQSYEVSFGIDFKEVQYSVDEILDLPQRVAEEKGKKFVICIDEFQNVGEYAESLAFQRKLRSHWQLHNSVCYCLYGSKRHMLLDIFGNYEMPFYKFGDMMFLDKIAETDWIPYIQERFKKSRKQISAPLASLIVRLVDAHPYYVQQLAHQVWLRTDLECSEAVVLDAHESLVDQMRLLFSNLLDSLTLKQINFLHAVVDGVENFSSKEVLDKYQLGTSANIKNLRGAMLQRDLIDVLPGNKTELQDPIFGAWLKQQINV